MAGQIFKTIFFVAFCFALFLMAGSPQASASSDVTLYDNKNKAIFTFKLPDLPSYTSSKEFEGYKTGIHMTDNGLAMDLEDNYFLSFGMDREESYINSRTDFDRGSPVENDPTDFQIGISAGFHF